MWSCRQKHFQSVLIASLEDGYLRPCLMYSRQYIYIYIYAVCILQTMLYLLLTNPFPLWNAAKTRRRWLLSLSASACLSDRALFCHLHLSALSLTLTLSLSLTGSQGKCCSTKAPQAWVSTLSAGKTARASLSPSSWQEGQPTWVESWGGVTAFSQSVPSLHLFLVWCNFWKCLIVELRKMERA